MAQKGKSSSLLPLLGVVGASGILVWLVSRVGASPTGSATSPGGAPGQSDNLFNVERDPLPLYELSQINIVNAVLEYFEHRWEDKLLSVIFKAKSHVNGRAWFGYVVACMRRFVITLREDALYIDKEEPIFAEWIKTRKAKIAETRDNLNGVESAMGSIPVVGQALAAVLNIADNALISWASEEKGRTAVDQLLPVYEGVGIIKGISFMPGSEMPNLNAVDQSKRAKVTKQWLIESERNIYFSVLPVVPDRTEFRYAPSYGDFAVAVDELERKS